MGKCKFRMPSLVEIIITLFLVHKYTSTPFTLCQNTKYLRSQRFLVDIANSPDVWNPLEFNVTLPKALQNMTSELHFIALDTVHIQFEQLSLQFTCDVYANDEVSLQFLLYSQMASKITKLAFRYLILQNSSPNIASFKIHISASIFIWNLYRGVGVLNENQPFINSTNGIVHVLFIRGMNVSAIDDNNLLDVALKIWGNSTQITLQITSTSSTPTYVRSLDVFFLIFNKEYYDQPTFASFFKGSLSGPTNSLVYTNISKVYEAATMLGISSFFIKGNNFLDFSVTFNNSDSFWLSSQNQESKFTIQYVLFNTFYCSYLTPYFSQSEDTCLDRCFLRSYNNEIDLICEPCSFDCLTCNNRQECLTCSSLLDHRVLNNESRCVPLPGYFQTSTSQCKKCGEGCLQCISQIQCLKCSFQSKLVSKTCVKINDPPPPPITIIIIVCLFGVGIMVNNIVIIILINKRDDIVDETIVDVQELGTCDICLQELILQPHMRIRCVHIFHVGCIIQWGLRRPECPYRCGPINDNDEYQVFCRCGCRRLIRMTFQNIRDIQNRNAGDVQFLNPGCNMPR